MRRTGFWGTSFTLALALVSVARADVYLHGWENQFEGEGSLRLIPELRYLRTTSHYGASGNATIPTGFESVARQELDITARFGLVPKLSIFARGAWTRTDLTHTTLTSDSMGAGDQALGATFRLWDTRGDGGKLGSRFDLQLQAELPAYDNSAARLAGTPFRGDGTYNFAGGGFFFLPIVESKLTLLAIDFGAAYVYRSDGFAGGVPWRVGFTYEPIGDAGIFLNGGARGFRPLQDTNGFGTSGTLSQNNGAGGEAIVNSKSPSFMAVRGEAGYQVNNDLRISAEGTQTLFGEEAPNFLSVALRVQIRLGRGGTAPQTEELARPSGRFVNYGTQAKVTRSSDRLNLIKIDKGSADGVEVGQAFDIFTSKPDGSSGKPVARAKVTAVENSAASLSVIEYYREILIEEGFVVRRPLD